MHLSPGDGVQNTIISRGIETPKPRFANVREARAELVAQEPEQSAHDITDTGGVRHDAHPSRGDKRSPPPFPSRYYRLRQAAPHRYSREDQQPAPPLHSGG